MARQAVKPNSGGKRRVDRSRRVAYDAVRAVSAHDAYANLALDDLLRTREIGGRDAAFATELVYGTCRLRGTYDRIIVAASGRRLKDLQPAVIDVLRLGAHQLLAMRVPPHAAIAASVDLAGAAIGERVTGLVNAVLRKVAARDLDGWLDSLAEGLSSADERALRGHHPRWIADAYAEVLPDEDVASALAANNDTPPTTLVVRPGLAATPDLVGQPLPYSPFGTRIEHFPGDLPAVRDARAGVQDEGSQLVAWALSKVSMPEGPWLDLCAGPGGKAALLAGLAREQGRWLLAGEKAPHRALLVAQSLAAYPDGDAGRPVVVTADGLRPPWRSGAFAAVLADVPCTGLGALRRRPEARWRRTAEDLESLVELQRGLLVSALDAAMPGGVVAYVTCSPHPAETSGVVESVLAEREDVSVLDSPDYLEVPDSAVERPAGPGRFTQLWPHRHGTDAMFLALLRKRG